MGEIHGKGNGTPLQYSCLGNPRTEEPRGLPSMESHRVGHDWSDLAAAAAKSRNNQMSISWWMGKQNVVYSCKKLSFSYEKKWHTDATSSTDEPCTHYATLMKPVKRSHAIWFDSCKISRTGTSIEIGSGLAGNGEWLIEGAAVFEVRIMEIFCN